MSDAFTGKWRYSLVGFGFSLVMVLIIGQLVRLQLYDPDKKAEIINSPENFEEVQRIILPSRGEIYDRNGVLMAGNETIWEVGAIIPLDDKTTPDIMGAFLSPYLGLPASDLVKVLTYTGTLTSTTYVSLSKEISQETYLGLESAGKEFKGIEFPTVDEDGELVNKYVSLDQIIFDPKLKRSYPQKEVAANIVGFVNVDGVGFYGIEQKYDDLLAESDESVWVSKNPFLVEKLPEVPPGTSVVLTIDLQIQAMTERVLDEAIELNGSETGMIAVMNPWTGEILSMAVSPRLDPNEYWVHLDFLKGKQPYNQVVSETYEPGSVFKVLTMAAAIDAGVVTPETVFVDNGYIEYRGGEFFNWNLGGFGPQDMTDCMRNSSNVCLVWVATQLDVDPFYSYMDAFGIGHTTGIDLANEVNGNIRKPGHTDWFASDLATHSFGQGLSVTPIQMLMAISAIATDGQMVMPRVLKSLIANGVQYEIPSQFTVSPISAETARTMTDMLTHSVGDESYEKANVPGFEMAGKTGTAEIPTEYGYTLSETNASFVGWGPSDDVEFVVYVWFEKPQTSIWGSSIAAPVFSEVVSNLVVLMDIPPDSIRLGLENGQ